MIKIIEDSDLSSNSMEKELEDVVKDMVISIF